MNPEWYVLYVKTGREKRIAELLNAEGIRAIVPIRTMMERRNGKIRYVEQTLLPSYVFVEMELVEKLYYTIRAIPGVHRFVGQRAVEKIPRREMEIVILLANDGSPLGISEAKYIDGQYGIESGPLKKLETYITKYERRRNRATVTIPLLNRTHTIDLALTTIDAETITQDPESAGAPGMRENEDHREEE